MAAVGVWTLVALLVLAGFVMFVIALIDLVRRPQSAWTASGQNQLVWVLIVVLVGVIGPLLYLVVARPALDNASDASQMA